MSERSEPPRPRSSNAAPSSGGPGVDRGRLGPYDVSLLLVTAPGARIFEARGDDGRPALLQVSYLRAATGGAEREERDDFIAMMRVATEHLAADPEINLSWHGHAEQPDGSVALAWALPWEEEALRIGRAGDYVESVQRLVAAAIALLDRIATRHDRGRLDPLLSEDLLLVPSDGPPRLVGLPIHVPALWVSPELPSARFAPEELALCEPSRAGDMWRLGQCLKGLSKGLGRVPDPLLGFFDALCHANPALRLTNPASATLDLTALAASLRTADLLPDDTSPSPVARAGVDDLSARDTLPAKGLGDLALTKLRSGAHSPGDQPTVLDGRPVMMHARTSPKEPPQSSILERDTIIDVPRPRELDSSEDPTLDQGRITVADVRAGAPEEGGSGLPTERLTAWDRARKNPASAKGPGGTLVGVRKMAQQTPRGTPSVVSPTGPAGTLVGVRPMQLPPGSSATGQLPLLAPVTYHGPMPAELRAKSESQPELPPPALVDPALAPDPALVAPAPPWPADQGAAAKPAAPTRRPLVRYLIEGALVVLLSALGSYAWSTLRDEQAAPVREGARPITERQELVLRSSPPDALVVGEEDGRVLGKTPLAFLTNPETPAAVLVTARDHEPQRVLLADRGSLLVELSPLPPGEPCQLDLRVVGGMKLEGVAAHVDAGLKYRIAGAAVLRNPKGRGAWIVRCPELGGPEKQVLLNRAAPQRVELYVTEPAGAALFLEGSGVGRTPARRTVASGFALVRVETIEGAVERWVPAFAPSELRLPRPSAAR